ncbi:hypothetical protein [Pseudovibrio sp. WM33]|uniref:hypothetical protein n=1 Tax=Pseudovibrio sp. WM33 TaxID=1735585 RepID=UPI0007AE99BE|nr:hypothetical protein [Pseudovibrio sp. WM33]KZL24684.1 hypothetical protein PsWM33_02358 [Pseudovibrio sp. WM33]
MISIAKPFIVWAAYPSLIDYFLGDVVLAAYACLALTVVVSFDNLRRGFLIDWTAIVFFLAVPAFHYMLGGSWLFEHPLLLISAIYTLVASGSLFIGKPYTLQYARERTPEEFWAEEIFLTINYHLTLMWTLIFLSSFILSVLAVSFPDYWPIFALTRNSLIAIGLVIPDQYPDYYLQKRAGSDV